MLRGLYRRGPKGQTLMGPASAGTEQAAIRIGWRQRAAVGIGNADHRVIIRRRGTRLEGFQDGPAALARTGPHAAHLIDADQLDPGRHLERDSRLVDERKLQKIPGDRRGKMTACRTLAEISRLVVAHIDARDTVPAEADGPGALLIDW